MNLLSRINHVLLVHFIKFIINIFLSVNFFNSFYLAGISPENCFFTYL